MFLISIVIEIFVLVRPRRNVVWTPRSLWVSCTASLVAFRLMISVSVVSVTISLVVMGGGLVSWFIVLTTSYIDMVTSVRQPVNVVMTLVCDYLKSTAGSVGCWVRWWVLKVSRSVSVLDRPRILLVISVIELVVRFFSIRVVANVRPTVIV